MKYDLFGFTQGYGEDNPTMKILILNWKDIKNPRKGGAEIVTHEYAKQFVKNKHEVLLLSPAFSGCRNTEVIDGVQIRRLGIKRNFNYLFIHILVFLYYQRKLKHHIDLVIDQIHWIPFFTPLYVKEEKIAFIHEVAQNIWEKQFGKILGFIGKKLELLFFIFYKSTPFLTVSATTKMDLVNFGIPENNITVISNGINIIPLAKLSQKAKDPTFIFVGRITRVKNIEDTIVAFKGIKTKLSGAKLWIVGSVDDKRYCKELFHLASKLTLLESITFWGFVSEKKKLDLLTRSFLLLHTSLTEGWGLVIIEANAMGTPSVVYHVPGLTESVVDYKTGLIVRRNEPSEVAKLALDLWEDKCRYVSMQKKCLAWARQFSWETSYKKFINLLFVQ